MASDTVQVIPGSRWVYPLLPVTRDFADTILGQPESRKAGASLLEMGCGHGYLSIMAARRGLMVTATDINPFAISRLAAAAANDVSLTGIVSDLYGQLPGDRRFSIIAFAPPTVLSGSRLLAQFNQLCLNLLPEWLTRIPALAYKSLVQGNAANGRALMLNRFISASYLYCEPDGVIYLTLFADDLDRHRLAALDSEAAWHWTVLKVLDPGTGLTMVKGGRS